MPESFGETEYQQTKKANKLKNANHYNIKNKSNKQKKTLKTLRAQATLPGNLGNRNTPRRGR